MNGKQSHYDRVFKIVCRKYGEKSVYAMVAKMHDHVEDGLINDENLEKAIAEEWGYNENHRRVKRAAKAIRALTRDRGRTYKEYIKALCPDRVARKVKIEDLKDNALRWDSPPPGDLLKRYEWAIDYIDSYEFRPVNAIVWSSAIVMGVAIFWFITQLISKLQ